MRQKHLESALSSMQREFPDPDITLEQYPTSPHLAASVALMARDHGHVGPGCTVLDLGCGTGMLAMAVALLESDTVIAVDCDANALAVARENAKELLDGEDDRVEFILAKVKPTNTCETTIYPMGYQRGKGKSKRGGPSVKLHGAGRQGTSPAVEPDPFDGMSMRSKCVDTVVCNPPFGTKNNAGMDVRFLQTAVRLARRAVYSFHKSSTRAYLQKLVTDKWQIQFTVVAEMQFDIDRMYKFHKEKTRDVAVDLIRIDLVTQGGQNECLEEEVCGEDYLEDLEAEY